MSNINIVTLTGYDNNVDNITIDRYDGLEEDAILDVTRYNVRNPWSAFGAWTCQKIVFGNGSYNPRKPSEEGWGDPYL